LRRPATLNVNVNFQCPGIISDAWQLRIYRSGFSNLGAADVSVLDMVGSNNVGAADGLAKLSTFQGCEALTDAEVQGAYDSDI
jgi:hypothetical protein